MNNPSVFSTYGLKTNWNFNNDWYLNTVNGRNGGNCFHYGTSASGTYKPFAEGALETPFLMVNSNTSLKFWHNYATENEWDGGYVEGWINGEWKVMQMIGGYPGWVCNELMDEYKYHPAFTNTKTNWEQKTIDLSGLSGFVKFRFHFVGEGANHFRGWFIDDIQYTYQQTVGTPEHAAISIQSTSYPNPFRDETRINYPLEKAAHISLDIYDIAGKKVCTLLNEFQLPGEHTVSWNRNNGLDQLDQGIYFYILSIQDETGLHTDIKKLVRMD